MWDISKHLINDKIRVREVRLIGADGEQVGVVSKNEAMDMAEEAGLDLVCVSPKANPPVCKIIDYGKYKYEEEKKAKEARKKQSVITVKEIRMSPNIDQHDLETKAKNAIKFLKSGDRVKVTIRFRGREMAHQNLGNDVLNNFADLVKDFGQVDKRPKMEGRNMSMFLSPSVEE